ncbi:hypothetical protein [Sulfitobacter sp. AS59]|uniref:hypothetical protein n=1 Tax=Sulfitobacter sp. AS59 TaxID=3135784 RepID=UPI0031710854
MTASNHILRALALAFCAGFWGHQAAADFKMTAVADMAIGVESKLLGEGDAQRLGLANVASVDARMKFTNRIGAGRVLSFGVGLEASAYPSEDASDKVALAFTGSYQFNLDAAKKWQARAFFKQKFSRAQGTLAFSRTRIGGRLQYKHSPAHTTRMQMRFGHRNQNEDLLAGYDQGELLLSVTHQYRPSKDRLMVAATLYGEARRADDHKFSYDEIGGRLVVSLPLTEKTTVSGRIAAFTRNYDGAFSNQFNVARADKRFSAKVQIDRRFSNRLRGSAYVGWEKNQSNIVARAYGGPVAGLGLRMSWN